MLRGRDRYGSRRAGLASQGELFGDEEEDGAGGQFPDGDRKPSTEQGDAHSFHDVRTGPRADPGGNRVSMTVRVSMRMFGGESAYRRRVVPPPPGPVAPRAWAAYGVTRGCGENRSTNFCEDICPPWTLWSNQETAFR